MTECPGTDALTTATEALGWDFARAARHIDECPQCRGRLALIEQTHEAFDAVDAIEPAVLAAIGTALRVESRAASKRASLLEAALAGCTAIVVVASAGGLRNAVAAAAAFALGSLGVLLWNAVRPQPVTAPSH